MLERIDLICDAFEEAWKQGLRPQIEEYLGTATEPERFKLLEELLKLELDLRRRSNEILSVEEYRRRFPGHAHLIDCVFASKVHCEPKPTDPQAVGEGKGAVSELPETESASLPRPTIHRVDQIGDQFEDAWIAGQRPRIKDYLEKVPEPERPALLRQLIRLELHYRNQAGEEASPEEYLAYEADLDSEWIRAAIAAQKLPQALPGCVNWDGPFPQRFGRYCLLRRLGSGGMGTVYLAEDTRLQIRVALKLPHTDLLAAPGALEQFYREARAAARLSHPGLSQVFDVGRLGDTHYLAMRYIEGASLSPRPLREPRVVAMIVRKLAEAMAEAHRLAVVHRDLKPANILLTPQGEPVITDFGLALRCDTTDVRTASGLIAGTWPYMAPEQIRGDQDALGPGCDIYSLGVVLYELLTGRRPFRATEREQLRRQILRERPPPPSRLQPGLDPQLEVISLKALAKQITSRWASMDEFAAALAEYLGSAPLTAETLRPLLRRKAIHFVFAGLGEHAPASVGPKDRLFLDVGNDLRPGVLDHHHLTAHSGSAAGLVLAHAAFIDGAVCQDRSPEAPFAIVLHDNPDLDCIASAYLSLAYLTTRTFPQGVDVLARYADEVDEGRQGMSLANPFTLYAAYMRLTDRLRQRPWNSDVEYWQACVRSGLELVAYVVSQAVQQGLPFPGVDAFACPDMFGPQDRQKVQADIQRYRRKLEDPRCHARQDRLRLPGQFGGTVEAEALLIRDVENTDDPDRCAFFKDWARTDAKRCPNGRGFVALSVFLSEGTRQVRRCILSVTPDSGASLFGLGNLLDQEESDRRRQIYRIDDRQTDPVTGEAKPSRPGYANADPWYDGRAHRYTIVDAPRSGTLLTADEVEAIFMRFGGREAGSDH
jgi:hypothetical protein